MANVYARSTDGNNADSGATWALAKATVAGACSAAAAGDTVYVSQAHAESLAADITIAMPGTLVSPIKLICGNDAAEPPTAVATTATVTTSTNTLTFTGHGYVYGFAFQCGRFMYVNNSSIGRQIFENCQFKLSVGAVGQINAGGGSGISGSYVLWKNCDVRFSDATQNINVPSGRFDWRGGSVLSGGTSPSNLFKSADSDRCGVTTVDGVDLSNLSSTVNLVALTTSIQVVTFRNCKLPASWSGSLCSASPVVGSRISMFNCDSGDTNYRLWVEDYAGSIKSETTIIRTGGASDGTTGLSWKMVSGANAEYPTHLLESPEIVIWNDTTGASKTVTVEIVHDSAGAGSGSKFQDDEIWLQVQYYGTSGFPLGAHITDCKADVLATAANQADSSETWTTTGLASPVKQALSVTFTPQEKGYFIARVVLAKASKTVYVCPKATVS